MRTTLLLLLMMIALPLRAQTVYYVDAGATGTGAGDDWTNAFTDLQQALGVAASGDEVWVAAGTYVPGGDRADAFVVPSGVGVYGGFDGSEVTREERDWEANVTVLSGEIGDPGTIEDNSYNVVQLNGNVTPVTETTVIDGFTITRGYADGDFPDNDRGAGLYCEGMNGTCSPTIRNTSFISNTVPGGSGGAFFANGRQGVSNPVLINVLFASNSASANGGAFYADARGGGTPGESSPIFINVNFNANAAQLGGGALYAITSNDGTANPVFINTLFQSNIASSNGDADGEGGAVYAIVSGFSGTVNPAFYSTTLYGNSAGSEGGAVNVNAGSSGAATLTFVNSIVWGNGDAPVLLRGDPSATGTFTNTLIEGGVPFGADDNGGNLDVDPMLADPGAGDYSLLPGSPALDAGDNTLLDSDTYDLDGDTDTGETIPFDLSGGPRIVDNDGDGGSPARVDLGAFEAPPGVQLPVELTTFEATADGADVVLRWTTASETSNAGFEVQRMDAGAWTVLAFVAGRGTTAEAQAYVYRVDGLAPGAHRFRLKQVDYDGGFAYSPEVEAMAGMPAAFVLEAAYPNPFNPETRLRFAVRASGPVRVEVFDTAGRLVQVLYEGIAEAGEVHPVAWNASGVASGVYVVRLTGATFAASRAVTLLR